MNKKLGYYTVGNQEFELKFRALLHAQQTGQQPVWHFNDEAFGSYNWTVEPEASLDSLYDARAREIREAYDYVVLSYSGGADSNNMLEAFLRQGLHVDEIVSNWAIDIGKSFLDLSGKNRNAYNNNAEFKLHTEARLADIRKRSPRTKITVNDTSKDLISSLIVKDDPTWVLDRNDVLNITGVVNYNILQHAEIRKNLDRNLKIAFVLGVDKPRLRVVGDDLFLYFQDKTVNMITVNEHIVDYTNTEVVLFYWSPTTTDLLAKQAHVMRKMMQLKPKLSNVWRGTDYATQRTVGEVVLKNILYTSTWNPEWFQVNKVVGDWDSDLDYWFTRGMRGTKEHSNWLRGVEFLAPKIVNFLMRDHTGIRGTQFFYSKDYYIGKINAPHSQ